MSRKKHKPDPSNENSPVEHLTQNEAIKLERELIDGYGFSVDQLVELHGLSVATAIAETYPSNKIAWICCGPGKNGCDGLVCARHLKLFGYKPTIVCPKPGQDQLYEKLLKQCEIFDIPLIENLPTKPQPIPQTLIVDAVFGLSYKPPCRDKDLASLLDRMQLKSNSIHPLICIDVPSGWNVDTGPINMDEQQEEHSASELQISSLQPDCLVSLTAPKLCSLYFEGRHHFLAGRYVPEYLMRKYSLERHEYPGASSSILLS